MIPRPPPLESLLLGTQLAAGLGVATIIPELDFETYSEAGYVWDDAKQKWRGPPGAPKDSKGLPVVGAEPYAAHPTCEIIWLSYDLKDGLGKRRWRPGLAPPLDLIGYLAAGGIIEAWNVGFERWIWKYVCHGKYGWPAVHDDQWRCAMAKARASQYPGKLEAAGKVLSLTVQKDDRGADLMKRLSMPRNPTAGDPRRRVLPLYEHPGHDGLKYAAQRKLVDRDFADTEDYGQYNETDIAAEAEASSLIPDLEGEELLFWQAHERINWRGVHIDRAGVENCIAIVEQAHSRYNGELAEITGIDAASKVAQLQTWLRERNVHLESLDEDAVSSALEWNWLTPEVRRVLEIRAAVGSASVKKLFAIRNRLSADDRLRDLYIFAGARTSRSTGEGPQPTNLPKAGPDTIKCGCGKHYGLRLQACPWCSVPRAPDARVVEWNPTVAEDALRVIATRSLAHVEYYFGDAMLTIAGCLRALFTAAPGHDLISTDYNSIEAVGLAMVSGEKWRIEVFRGDGKIYETSASMMYKVPYPEFAAHKKQTGQHHPLRQKGKIGELAFGYQGWVGAAAAFGMPGTEQEIKADILAWRAASPSVEWLWGGQTRGKATSVLNNATAPDYAGNVDDRLRCLASKDYRARWDASKDYRARWDASTYYFGVEGMAVKAVMEPGEWHVVERLDGTDSGVAFKMHCDTLYCRIPSGRVMSYHRPRLAESDRGGMSISFEGWNSNPKNGPYGWIAMNTWGGRLVENIIQAVCRDVLRACCIELERHGYPVVLHTYDEPVSEIPEGWGSIEEYERICTEEVIKRCPWAADWPIRAPGGYRAKRYRKG
jgi:DNA polymerase